MGVDQTAMATVIAKDEIRDLVLLYARASDRYDGELMRSLYTKDAIDNHGALFRGPAQDFVSWLEKSWAKKTPGKVYSGHHICNHLISVMGDEAEGEAYVQSWHVRLEPDGSFSEHLYFNRFLDRYRKEDGRWKIALRNVSFDVHTSRPFGEHDELWPNGIEEPSYARLTHRLFGKGPRV
jgi:hypothetical protein